MIPIPLIALAVVGVTGAVIAGFVAGTNIGSETPGAEESLELHEPSPLATPDPTPPASPTPSNTSGIFEDWKPPQLNQDWSSRILPSPTMRTLPSPSLTALPTPPAPDPTPPEEAAAPARIEFLSLPQTVKAGQQFIVRWRVAGPTGAVGQSANLTVLYEASSVEEGSESSARSKSSQSYGPFTVPEEFEATFSFGSMPADVHLTATAQVDGKTLEERRTVRLVP